MKKIREQRPAEAEYKDRYDLDGQLRNLENIKRRREEQDQDRRDQAMKRRQEYLTRVYFEQEMRKLHEKQGRNPDSYAFYTELGKDEKTRGYRTTFVLKENQESDGVAIDQPEQRQFMIRPNDLEYFYEEKETSEKVYQYHQRLNAMWRFATSFAVVFAAWAFYKAYEQQEEIWSAAGAVVIPKTSAKGGTTRVRDDGSVEVVVDGKVVDVITDSNMSEDRKPGELQSTLRQAIAYAITAKTKAKKLQDFYFYSKIMKPELKDSAPTLYNMYTGQPTQFDLSHEPYGIAVRLNQSAQVESTRNPDCELSIFDPCCFNFYLVKYVEIIGVEPLIAVLSEQKSDEQNLSNHKQLSYWQKVRLIDFIVQSERELGVEESSWRHCLLYLFLNGAISQRQFSNSFQERKGPSIPRYKLEKLER